MRVDQRKPERCSTCSKFTEGVVLVAGGLLQLEQPPGVIHQVLLVLRVHSVHLPVLTALIKQRAQEELGKPTEIVIMIILLRLDAFSTAQRYALMLFWDQCKGPFIYTKEHEAGHHSNVFA